MTQASNKASDAEEGSQQLPATQQDEAEQQAGELIEAEGTVNEPANPSGEPVEVPVDDARYSLIGIVFLLVSLGSFSLWAALAPLSSAVVSIGEVVVDSYRKSIQHYEGGIVERIYVRNGDRILAGDPLIALETTQNEAQREATLKQLLTTQAELERLRSEQTFSQELVFSEQLQRDAQQHDDVRETLIQQQQLQAARITAYLQEQQALGTRVEQINQQISGLGKQHQILEQQLASLQQEHESYATLFKEGLGDGQRARELNRAALQTQNEMARIGSETARLKIQITETDLQIATRKQDFLKDIGERIKQVQTQYYDLQERLMIVVDRVERSVIRAPEAGVVVDMQVHTLGGVAPSGTTLLDIVPEEDQFVVEAKIMTQDINDIYQGQKADIRFSAFNAKVTKVIEGEVVHVSADRLLNERDQTPYYLARLKVTEQGAKDLGDDLELKPGMPAEVMIRRGERTLFSYLIKPISDSFARSLKET